MKYRRNKPSKLGEIGNSGAITTYFTKRSEVYFYLISIVSRTSYLVLSTSYNSLLLQKPRNIKPVKTTFLCQYLAVFK